MSDGGKVERPSLREGLPAPKPVAPEVPGYVPQPTGDADGEALPANRLARVVAERQGAAAEARFRASDGAEGAPPMARIAAQRQSAAADALRRLSVMRKAAGPFGAATIPQGGSPLAAEVKARMEPKLGADLSGVRLHTGGDSARAARDLGAKAFTVGADVHFGAGQYAPGSKEGDRLLAHELTHVVQGQRSGVQRKAEEDTQSGAEVSAEQVSQPEDPAEKEADAVADDVADKLHDGGPAQDEAKDRKKGKKKDKSARDAATADTEEKDDEKGGDENPQNAEPAPENEPTEKPAQISAKLEGVARVVYRAADPAAPGGPPAEGAAQPKTEQEVVDAVKPAVEQAGTSVRDVAQLKAALDAVKARIPEVESLEAQAVAGQDGAVDIVLTANVADPAAAQAAAPPAAQAAGPSGAQAAAPATAAAGTSQWAPAPLPQAQGGAAAPNPPGKLDRRAATVATKKITRAIHRKYTFIPRDLDFEGKLLQQASQETRLTAEVNGSPLFASIKSMGKIHAEKRFIENYLKPAWDQCLQPRGPIRKGENTMRVVITRMPCGTEGHDCGAILRADLLAFLETKKPDYTFTLEILPMSLYDGADTAAAARSIDNARELMKQDVDFVTVPEKDFETFKQKYLRVEEFAKLEQGAEMLDVVKERLGKVKEKIDELKGVKAT